MKEFIFVKLFALLAFAVPAIIIKIYKKNFKFAFQSFQSFSVVFVFCFFAGLSSKQSATMSAASSQKVVLKSTTKVSLNER